MKKACTNSNKAMSASSANNQEALKEGTTMSNAFTQFVEAIKNGLITDADLEQLVQAKAVANAEPVEKPKETHWTKAYSVNNVRIIVQMIKAGKTFSDITERFHISRTTIRRYLDRRYGETNRGGVADKYWDMLLKNSRTENKRDNSNTAEDTDCHDITDNDEFAAITEEAEENYTENVIVTDDDSVEFEAEMEPEHLEYVLDSQMVQRHEGRQQLPSVVEKLQAMGATFEVHSRQRMEELATVNPFSGAGKCAEEVLNTLPVADTLLYLKEYAYFKHAMVITCSERTRTECARIGVETIDATEFLTEIEDYADTPLTEARKFDIPCRMNNNRRIICDLQELKQAISKWFNLQVEDVKISVTSKTERQKNSPTGRIRLEVEDKITFEAMTEDHFIMGQLEMICEEIKANAVQRLYTNQPAAGARKEWKLA